MKDLNTLPPRDGGGGCQALEENLPLYSLSSNLEGEKTMHNF